jgi:hypothetical protein
MSVEYSIRLCLDRELLLLRRVRFQFGTEGDARVFVSALRAGPIYNLH